MKKIIFFLGMCAVMMVITQSAQAAGIGFYGTGGAAFMNWQYKGEKGGSSTDYFYGGGLVIDSTVARDQIFGYRLTLGYEQYVVTYPEYDAESDPIHRFSMSHTFGFGVLRSEMVRLWIGPRIGLHYLYKHDSGYSIDAAGVDCLLGMGLNINAGDTFTFFFDLGFGYMGIYNINHSGEIGNAFGLDGKMGFMFRIGDTYRAKPAPIEVKVEQKG